MTMAQALFWKCTLQSANLTPDSYLHGLFWQGHNWNSSFAIKTLQKKNKLSNSSSNEYTAVWHDYMSAER